MIVQKKVTNERNEFNIVYVEAVLMTRVLSKPGPRPHVTSFVKCLSMLLSNLFEIRLSYLLTITCSQEHAIERVGSEQQFT